MGTFSHPVSTQPAVPHRPSLAPRTAFVLAGGASLGAIQVGMLRALYERGVAPDLLVGTSAGALNAAFIASRPQTVATAEELAQVWRGLHRENIFPINPRMVIGGLANHRDHLVPDTGLRRLAGRHLQIARLEHASVTPLVGARLQSDLARYAAAAEPIVLPAANRERIQPTDFDHASRLIAHALAAARTALEPPVAEPVAA